MPRHPLYAKSKELLADTVTLQESSPLVHKIESLHKMIRDYVSQLPENNTCHKCKLWGDGSGTGSSYDAGAMNYCKAPGVDGYQHPSFGACGEPPTMLYVDGSEKQHIQTRWSFGCNQFQPIKK